MLLHGGGYSVKSCQRDLELTATSFDNKQSYADTWISTLDLGNGCKPFLSDKVIAAKLSSQVENNRFIFQMFLGAAMYPLMLGQEILQHIGEQSLMAIAGPGSTVLH